MIICSCNVLTDKDLEKAAAEIRDDPSGRIVTPGGCFKKLNCRPKCGNCFPMVVQVIHRSYNNSKLRESRPDAPRWWDVDPEEPMTPEGAPGKTNPHATPRKKESRR